MSERERLFRELLAYAEETEDVLGLYVFGSRGWPDGLADDASDYDVGVVLRDDADLDAFDARWPYVHGAAVEVTRATLSQLRAHGEPDTASAWARPLYAEVDLRLDKSGEVAALLEEKRELPAGAREKLARNTLDAYVNATYRSLRHRLVGAGTGARLDAAESVPPLLTFLFALEGRVRPFNKYLEQELRDRPVAGGQITIDDVTALLEGDPRRQRTIFRTVEELAKEQGFEDVIAAWEPDVAWLRGEATYRETASGGGGVARG